MFGCDGISDHASWNEVFHYRDTKLSCIQVLPPANAYIKSAHAYIHFAKFSVLTIKSKYKANQILCLFLDKLHKKV